MRLNVIKDRPRYLTGWLLPVTAQISDQNVRDLSGHSVWVVPRLLDCAASFFEADMYFAPPNTLCYEHTCINGT